MGAAKSEKADGVDVLIDVIPRFRGRIDAHLLERAVRAALSAARADHSGEPRDGVTTPAWRAVLTSAHTEVGIHVTDDAEMQQLNARYRQVDKPTDVLSFSFVEEDVAPAANPRARPSGWPIQLGEIAISLPYAERQATDLGHTREKEIAWLIIHGALQLLGYTHETEKQAMHMEALEQMALDEMGLGADR